MDVWVGMGVCLCVSMEVGVGVRSGAVPVEEGLEDLEGADDGSGLEVRVEVAFGGSSDDSGSSWLDRSESLRESSSTDTCGRFVEP